MPKPAWLISPDPALPTLHLICPDLPQLASVSLAMHRPAWRLLLASVLEVIASDQQKNSAPNVLFIVADDLGISVCYVVLCIYDMSPVWLVNK